MKRLSIFKGGVLTNQLDFSTIEELEQQFEYHKSINSFGRNAEQNDDATWNVSTQNEDGTWNAPTKNDDATWNPAEYSFEIGEATKSQEEINQESRAYIKATDWYAIRSFETGVPVPTEILSLRAAARAAVVE
jgi:hypothetical protein